MIELISIASQAIQDPGDHRWMFRCPQWENGYAIVTNGPIVVCVEVDQGEFNVHWLQPSQPKPLFAAIENTMKRDEWQPVDINLPSLESPPDGNWQALVKCDECSGTGQVTCDYGHEHQCPDCGGSGKVKDWHPLSREKVYIPEFGGFNYRYVWAIQQMQSAAQNFRFMKGPRTTYRDGHAYVLAFSFAGGFGGVMPLGPITDEEVAA